MTPQPIELQFNPRAAIPAEEVARYADRATELSAATRRRWQTERTPQLDVRYGDSTLSTLDIFPAAQPNAPIHVFLHGGYWRGRDKSDYSFIADALAPQHITTVLMNYDLCPNVRLDDIVAQVKRGFQWIAAHANDFGGDPRRLTASGHSAGAHLIAALLADEHQDVMPSAALLISGIYELAPVLQISVNAQIGLQADQVDALSPMRHPPRRHIRLAIIAGGAEPSAWVAQSRDYAEVGRHAGNDCLYGEMPGEHHYSIMTHFETPSGWLSQLAAGMAR